MATITKKDLIDRISASTNQTRVNVKEVVQSFLDNIVAELGNGNRLEFRDFGVFEIKHRASRIAQNPKKPSQKVFVPPRCSVKFKAGRMMKQAVTTPDSDTRPIDSSDASKTAEQVQ